MLFRSPTDMLPPVDSDGQPIAPTPGQRFWEQLAPLDGRAAVLFLMGWEAILEDQLPLALNLDQMPRRLCAGGEQSYGDTTRAPPGAGVFYGVTFAPYELSDGGAARWDLLLWLLAGGLAAVGWVPLLAVFGLVQMAISGLTGLLIVYAILSWTQAGSPLSAVIDRLCAPFLGPFRRILPLVGGIDLSPLVLLVVLQVAAMVLATLQQSMLR